VTIVVAPFPSELRAELPYTNPDDPDYIESFMYADLDSLIELHGHLRAVNPLNQVNIRLASKGLTADEYATHLVLLGGIDWNPVTADIQERMDPPVRQTSRDQGNSQGGFTVLHPDGSASRDFQSRLTKSGAILEDVAHFFRAPNPFNKARKLTICNGMYGRGTLGAVRALTDAQFRDRNEKYLDDRFGDSEAVSILMRVQIVGGKVLTPDWTDAGTRLDEWPKAG
jgi:hypothetical protein